MIDIVDKLEKIFFNFWKQCLEFNFLKLTSNDFISLMLLIVNRLSLFMKIYALSGACFYVFMFYAELHASIKLHPVKLFFINKTNIFLWASLRSKSRSSDFNTMIFRLSVRRDGKEKTALIHRVS